MPPESPSDDPDLDTSPPMPPENEIGLDELTTIATQPSWARRFGRHFMTCLLLVVVAMAAALGLAVYTLMQPDTHPTPRAAYDVDPITDIQPDALRITDLTRDILEDGALVILRFTGTITNTSDTPQTLPELRVQLLDTKGIELDFWPAEIQKTTLQPNESASFQVRFLNPPIDRIATYRAFFKSDKPASPLIPAIMTAKETSATEASAPTDTSATESATE